jgi:hypothetical protein
MCMLENDVNVADIFTIITMAVKSHTVRKNDPEIEVNFEFYSFLFS